MHIDGFSVDAFRRTVDDDQIVVIALGDEPTALRERLGGNTETWLTSTSPHAAELDVLFGRPTGLPELLFVRHGVIVRWWLGHSGSLSSLDVKPDIEAPFTPERYRALVDEVRALSDVEAAWREVTSWRELPDTVPTAYAFNDETLRLERGGAASQRHKNGELLGTWRLRSDGDLDLFWKRFVRENDEGTETSELDRREVWQLGQRDGRVQVRPTRGLLPRLTASHRVFIADA